MSEYEYFEFQAVDRPLTGEEQAAVRHLSSHIDVMGSRAVVTYDYGGSFRHDPLQVVARFFDAMLYFSNWGESRLIFRFPKSLLEDGQVAPYLAGEAVSYHEIGEFALLDLVFLDEDGEELDWIEGSGQLSALLPLRQRLIEGDNRLLYLAWLKALTLQEPEEAADWEEPPVPPGLGKYSPDIQAFLQAFRLNPHLVAAAAETSPEVEALAEPALLSALARLPREEMEEFLLRLLRREPRVEWVLRQRLAALAGAGSVAPPRPSRTFGDLLLRVKARQAQERLLKKKENERARLKELNDLAPRAEQAWQEVEKSVQAGTARSYDQAVGLLSSLRELAELQNQLPAFNERLVDFRTRHSRRTALLERLRKARLD